MQKRKLNLRIVELVLGPCVKMFRYFLQRLCLIGFYSACTDGLLGLKPIPCLSHALAIAHLCPCVKPNHT